MKPIFTSETHPIEVAWLTSDRLQQPGKLGLSMAPGKQDEEPEQRWQRDLQTDLTRLQDHHGIDRLVCLLEPEEMVQLGIPTLLTEAQAKGIQTEHLPINDEGLPESAAAFATLINRVVAALAAGETVLVHCKGGRGRTGMVAAASLVQLGYDPGAAIALVQSVRQGALSTTLKRDYVYQFAKARSA